MVLRSLRVRWIERDLFSWGQIVGTSGSDGRGNSRVSQLGFDVRAMVVRVWY